VQIAGFKKLHYGGLYEQIASVWKQNFSDISDKLEKYYSSLHFDGANRLRSFPLQTAWL